VDIEKNNNSYIHPTLNECLDVDAKGSPHLDEYIDV
jgi:hypothetical protein